VLEIDGEPMTVGGSARRGTRTPRKPGQTRAKAAKVKRKVERRRR